MLCAQTASVYLMNPPFLFLLGTVLLDLAKYDLPHIAQAVVENMVLTDQLKQEDSQKVVTALLLQHRHQHQQPSIMRRLSSKKKRKIGHGSNNIGYNPDGEGIPNGKIEDLKNEKPVQVGLKTHLFLHYGEGILYVSVLTPKNSKYQNSKQKIIL